jgi:hypothetical protein
LDLQSSRYQSSANAAMCGHGGYHDRGGNHGGFVHGSGGRGEGSSFSSGGTKPTCQLCKKTGHTVLLYWNCFDRNFTGEEKTVNNVEAPGYNVNPAW